MVNPVPYPAVPRRHARIRMTISAGFVKEELDYAINAMLELGKKYKLICEPMVNTG